MNLHFDDINAVLFIILCLLFLVVILYKTFFWVYLWQLKEYRWDRMLDFLSTHSGKHATTNKWTLAEILLLFITISPYFSRLMSGSDGRLPFNFALTIFAVFYALRWKRAHLLPQGTIRAVLTSVLSIVILLSLPPLGLIISKANILSVYFTAAVTLVILPLVVILCVFVLQPFASVQKKRLIERAAQKIRQLHPVIIGITGSYGKSTTKEFLKAMLATKYRVLATPKNVNVDIGVAQTILENLKEEHQIFIVEMGAYREGEIVATCRLAPPSIGVLTAINEQHHSLFGSLETTKKAKAELLDALPKNGLAVINYDNELCMEVAEKFRAEKKFYSTKNRANIYATHISATPRDLEFTLHVNNQKVLMQTRLIGQQVVPSLLAAAAVANHLHVSLDQIRAAANKLRPQPGTMSLQKNSRGVYVIDDHYNSNPDGFMAALDYLGLWTDKKKIVLTPGMLELGALADSLHRRVGQRLGEVADLVIVTKKDFAKPLSDAAKQNGLSEQQILVETKFPKLAQLVSTWGPNDVVLVEGRIAAKLWINLQ